MTKLLMIPMIPFGSRIIDDIKFTVAEIHRSVTLDDIGGLLNDERNEILTFHKWEVICYAKRQHLPIACSLIDIELWFKQLNSLPYNEHRHGHKFNIWNCLLINHFLESSINTKRIRRFCSRTRIERLSAKDIGEVESFGRRLCEIMDAQEKPMTEAGELTRYRDVEIQVDRIMTDVSYRGLFIDLHRIESHIARLTSLVKSYTRDLRLNYGIRDVDDFRTIKHVFPLPDLHLLNIYLENPTDRRLKSVLDSNTILYNLYWTHRYRSDIRILSALRVQSEKSGMS